MTIDVSRDRRIAGRTAAMAILVVLVLCTTARTQGARPQTPRGPSTAEERDRLVRIAKTLEANPVAPGMAEDREWARQFIDQVPDIGVTICPKAIDYLRENPNYAYGPALEALAVVEGARFAIEHPDNKDPNAQALAMVEGTLRGYEALLNAEPHAGNLKIETLVAKRDSGMLAEYMKDACTAPRTASPDQR